MGAGYCRNLALENSDSKYIAFIDSDDIWKKNKLSDQLKFMEENKFKFTYTAYSSLNEINGEKKLLIHQDYLIMKNLLRTRP